MSDKSKKRFKKTSTGRKGRPGPVSIKREEETSKVVGEKRSASTVGQKHVKRPKVGLGVGHACGKGGAAGWGWKSFGVLYAQPFPHLFMHNPA